jgi:hypothetical protein
MIAAIAAAARTTLIHVRARFDTWELDEPETWDLVLDALTVVLGEEPATVDADVANVAIAAAEVVAHATGRPTQSDVYTERVTAFVERLPDPPLGIGPVALTALEIAASPEGELAEVWRDGGSDEWTAAVARVREPVRRPIGHRPTGVRPTRPHPRFGDVRDGA